MSAADSSSPAGSPSTITTRARPCDSPAVRKRNITRKRTGGPFSGPRPISRGSDEIVLEVEDDVDRADGQRGAERERAAASPCEADDQPEHDADHTAHEQRDR